MKSFIIKFLKINRFSISLNNPTFYLMNAVRRRPIPSIVIGLILSFISIPVIILKVKPSYNAESLLNIEPHLPRVLYNTDQSKYLHSYEDWLRTQVGIIRSFPILLRGLEIHKENGYTWAFPLESEQASVYRLIANLKVNQIRDTQLISISIESKNKEGLDSIVNSVVQSYIEFEEQREKKIDSFKLGYLKGEKSTTSSELNTSYKELEDLSRSYGSAISEEKNMYVYIEVLNDLQKSHNKLVIDKIQYQNKLKALSEKRNKLLKMDIKSLVEDGLKKDLVLIEKEKIALEEEQQIRLKLLNMQEGNPDRLEYQKKVERIRKNYQEIFEDALKKEDSFQRNKLLSDIDLEILNINTELSAVEISEKDLLKEMKKAQMQLMEYSTAVSIANTKKNEIDRLKDRLNRINQRVDEVNIELQVPGRITIVSKAIAPETTENAKKRIFIFAAFFVSMAIGFIFCLLIDFLDPTLKRVEDIQNTLGFPATGYIFDSNVDKRLNQSDINNIINMKPVPYIVEESRKIGLFLEKEKDDNKSKIFCFVSLTPDAGSTFLSNLVLSIINLSPSKKLFLKGNKQGDPFRYENHFTKKDITFSESFKTQMESYKNEFDMIFIDSSDLHSSTDTNKFIISSDVVVLVAEAGKNTWIELKDTIEYLNRLKVNVLSIILNKVKPTDFKQTNRILQDYYNSIHG